MSEASIARTALLALCPRCGKGKLYNGLLRVAPRCTVCDLDYAIFDAGDGPAVFVVLIAGGLVTGAALYVEFTFTPPIWVHALLWIPLTTILILAMLRFAKALLLVLQYRNKAGEGRLEP